MSNTDFLALLGGLAREDMKKTGVLASLTIAQGILESGWGKSQLATKANNLFGIKATSTWTGKTYTVETNECFDGVNMTRVEAVFRAYDSWAGSIFDHSALFSAKRYEKVVGETDYKKACQAVKDAGYATDPNYPSKLIALIEQHKLYEFDRQEGQTMPKICLDPGHYGRYNQSPEVSGYYESEAMWKLHLYLKSALELRGFQVVTTRSDSAKDLGLTARGSQAKGCDAFISLHSNACGTESVDYTIVYRAYDNLNNADEIAKKLGVEIGKLMGNKQTGKSGSRKSEKGNWDFYGVMHGARKAGCPLYLLIEHSFHTNKNATLWLMQEENLRKLANLEATILAEHFGLTTGETPENTPVEEAKTVPDWMQPSLDWAVENGVMTGDEKGDLRPFAPLTRGEFAVMLHAFARKFGEG